MPTFIEKRDYEFLLLAAKFCNKIDKYARLLDLNGNEVEELKDDNRLFNYVFENSDDYGSFTESFSKHKIQNMRINLSHLAQCCKNSKRYTVEIGRDLGIELPVHAFLPN
jgi:hypothetical protein